MALSGFMSKVAFVNKVPTLMKATSADPTPPQGHVYDEISRITFESLEQNDVLVEFLVERLKKTSPYIKLKVLLIMKAVLCKGHEEFRTSLSRQSQGIREAKSFSGPPDPLHGDTPYVNVRETAGELLQMLFDTSWTRNDGKQSYASSNMMKIEGFGSSSFGKIPENNQPIQSSTQGVSRSAHDHVSNAVQCLKDNIAYAFKQNSNAMANIMEHGVKAEDNRYDLFRERNSISRPSHTFNILETESNNQGGYSAGLSERLHQPRSIDFTETKMESVTLQSTSSSVLSNDVTSVKLEDQSWSQEASLVDKITAPGGIRLNPSKNELQEFTTKCDVLNFEKIVDLLNDKLQSSDYRVQMKSLFVIENVLHSSVSNAAELITTKLINRLEALSSSNQTAVRSKSTKLLHMLKPKKSEVANDEAIHLQENMPQNLQLVDLVPDSNGSSSGKIETRPQEDGLAELMSTLIDNVTLKENDDIKAMPNVESQTSKVVQSHRSKVDEANKSDSFDLFDLDPFSGGIHSGLTTQLQTPSNSPGNDLVVDTKSNNATNRDLTFDPYALDPPSLVSNTAQRSSNVAATTGFDFLLDDKSVGIQSEKFVDQVQPIQREFTRPQTVNQPSNQQPSTGLRLNPSQYYPMNPELIFASQPHSQGSRNMNFNAAKVIPVTGPRGPVNIINRPKPVPSNGFDFISGRQKPGAFDFVKDAMEASKRK